MFLKRLVLVNWGNVPDTEIDFGPINLLSGANGSGKTTVADALQTVMTAAHESLFHYNPGQDESSQRGRGGKRVRTLASYVLGCDDGSYARLSTTDGYIAACFHPTAQENGAAFTALVGVRAWLDPSGKQPLAREDAVVFFVLPEAELRLAHLRTEREGGLHVVTLDDIQQSLIAALGRRAVERYDQKRAYLKRLYGALRGRDDSVAEREALGAARAFSRFMAYKPVSSISQFVADEVLERKDLGEAIRSVSGQLKTIHSMEREAQDLKRSAQLLERAGRQAQTYLEGWAELTVLRYQRAFARQHEVQERLQAALADADRADRELTDTAGELALNEQRRRQAHERLVQLEAQRQGIPALQQKDSLEKEREELHRALAERAQQVLTQSLQSDGNARAARALADLLASPGIADELPQVADAQARQLVREVLKRLAASPIDITRLLQKDLTQDLAALEQHLDEVRQGQRAQNELAGHFRWREPQGRSRRDLVAELDFRRRERYRALTQAVEQKESEITRLSAAQTVYPPYVERALAALRAQCPQADARVLCDYVEVLEPHWQSAVEGYLGGARFDILVDLGSEAQAIRIVRALPGRDSRARIIQGGRALRDAARVKVEKGSIIEVLAVNHAVAKAYLTARYHGVRRVEGAEELKDTVRGVTAEGMGAGGYSMYRCDMPDADLVFGAGARARALAAKRAELDRLHAQHQEAGTLMQESARLREAVDAIVPVTYGEALEALLGVHRGLLRVEQLLTRLDMGAHASLDTELEGARRQDETLRQAAGGLNKRLGQLDSRRRDAQRLIQELSDQKEAAQEDIAQARQGVEDAHARWPLPDLGARLAQAQEAAAAAGQGEAAQARENAWRDRLEQARIDVSTALLAHNHESRSHHKIPDTVASGDDEETRFAKLVDTRREIDQLYNVLKNNVLVEKHEQLKALKADFNRIFVQNLCHEISQSLRAGRAQIDLLNKELTGHRFGSDQERFRFEQEDIPEFREYKGFLKEVAEAPGFTEGAGLFEAALSPRSAAVRDRLMTLLLSDDEQRSLQELERIADYRNYHRYEIYKDVEGKPPIALSEYGTGSGGQLETPAYIIRAASITSAWRYAEGTTHLRMVLVDEAFSKMDEGRSREVIGYLTRTLGLQLLFIMPTSKCGPFMDLVSNELVFAKVPSAPRGQLLTRVLVDRRSHNQERIAELWKQHRRSVREQAELDFMSDVLGEEPSVAGA